MKSWPSLSHRWLPQHSHLSLKWTENFRQLVTGIELRPEMHWRNVAAKGVQSGWGKTSSLDVSGELEDVKLWWHTVSQTDLAARPECKIFNDPALVLALKRPENINWDADIRKVKLVAPVCGRSWAATPNSTHTTHSSKGMNSVFFAPCFSRPCQQTTWLRGTFWTFSEPVHFWSAY